MVLFSCFYLNIYCISRLSVHTIWRSLKWQPHGLWSLLKSCFEMCWLFSIIRRVFSAFSKNLPFPAILPLLASSLGHYNNILCNNNYIIKQWLIDKLQFCIVEPFTSIIIQGLSMTCLFHCCCQHRCVHVLSYFNNLKENVNYNKVLLLC